MAFQPIDTGIDEALADIAAQGPPEPARMLRCSCGEEHPWSWYEPVRHGRKLTGRWAAPKVNPCVLCELPPEMIHEKRLRSRLLSAGVSELALIYSVDALVEQGNSEDPEQFRARVRQQQRTRGVLGVHLAQRPSYRALRQWKPPQWLVLHGPPGTGKSTIMAALARRLLDVPDDRYEMVGGRRTLVRSRVHAVEYHRLDDLLAREKAKMRGLDATPTKDAAEVGVGIEAHGDIRVPTYDRKAVLFIDELGLSPKPREAELLMMERIIGYRAEHGLCTVVATNRDYDEVAGPDSIYGARVGDRLKRGLNVPLTGDSWREAA